MKRAISRIMVGCLALAAVLFVLHPPERMLERWSKMSGLAKDVILVPSFEHLDAGEAYAYNGPTGGNVGAPHGLGDACNGTGTLASGTLLQVAPCIGVTSLYKACMAFAAGPGTPGAVVIACAPTSTTTIVASATATLSAVILNASTANATPSVYWQAGPE
jgi:hypothetical protein